MIKKYAYLFAMTLVSNICLASEKHEYTLRFWEEAIGNSSLLYKNKSKVIESINKGERGKREVVVNLDNKGFLTHYQSISIDVTGKESKFVKGNMIGFYLPDNPTASSLALLVNALQKKGLGNGKNDGLILSSNTKVSLEKKDQLSISNSKDEKLNVTLYTLKGLDYLPLSIWLDDEQHLFAYIKSADELIRKGFENNLTLLTEKQEQVNIEWLEQISTELTYDPKKLLIHNAQVFDVHTLKTSAKTSVLIEGNKITQVGADNSFSVPKNIEKVNAKGKFLMPGLWDNHIYYSEQHYGLLNIASGVTSVRDMGDASPNKITLAKSNISKKIGPRVVLSMRFQGELDVRYGTRIPIIRKESDLKKLIESNSDSSYRQLRNVRNLDPSLLSTVEAYAQKHNLHFLGEPPFNMEPYDYINAGAKELLHMYNVSQMMLPPRGKANQEERFKQHLKLSQENPKLLAFISAAKKHNAAFEPTLLHDEVFYTGISGQAYRGFKATINHLPLMAKKNVQATATPASNGLTAFDKVLEIVKFIHDSGVRLIPAAYSPNGYGLHRELELFVKAGIPNAEVLKMATYGSAKNLQMEDRLGAIEAGQLADLILIDGDPIKNISDIRKTHTVIRDGKVFNASKIYSALNIGAINR